MTYERLVPYRDAGTRFIRANYIPYREGGQVQGFFSLVSDVTQSKRAEQNARFLADASATLATDGATLLAAFGAFLGAALLLGWRVDINKFSLYMLYRNRLVRSYFGASSATRKPHPFTGFDPEDDPQLADMADQRPYHIVNTAIRTEIASAADDATRADKPRAAIAPATINVDANSAMS